MWGGSFASVRVLEGVEVALGVGLPERFVSRAFLRDMVGCYQMVGEVAVCMGVLRVVNAVDELNRTEDGRSCQYG